MSKTDPPQGGWGRWPGRFNRPAERLSPARGRLVAEVQGVGAEKSSAWTRRASVLKLTQVGEESILRRSREPFLRN